MKHKITKRIFLLATILFATVNCSVEKRLSSPEVSIPDSMPGTAESDSLCFADIEWSCIITDSLLSNLITEALENNKDLLTAASRVEELQKLYRVEQSGWYPSLGARAYIDRETNEKSGKGFVEDVEVAAKLTLSWEADFFGRIRYSNKGALAEYMKSIEGKRALQITLIADIATSYFELVALDNEADIIRKTIETRQENLRIAKLRFEGGLTTEIPYQQAKVSLADAAALLPEIEKKIKIKENEISFLTGRMPGEIERIGFNSQILYTENTPLGLPSDLIKRRPDVKAAEYALQSAMAKAGYAWADRFPRFTISLEGGFENNGFAGFLTAPLTYVIGDLTAPLFSFGKRKSKYEAAVAAYEGARLQYEKAVLTAFKEVSNSVAEYLSSKENVVLMNNLLESSRKYVNLATFQYINGYISYIDVLDAQRAYFNAQRTFSKAVRDEYICLITLYKSLGGGWTL